MRLYVKTLIIVVVTLIVITAGVYFLSLVTMGAGIRDIQEHEAQQNAERALSAIDVEVRDLEKIANDWAVWDDTYAFVQGTNPEYVSSNLMSPVFENLRINYLILLNSSGEVCYEKGYDLTTRRSVPVPPALHTYILAHQDIFTGLTPDGRSGTVLTPEGVLLLEMHPVLQSDGTGPAQGTYIIGRYLDSRLLASISERSYLLLTTYRVGSEDVPPAVQAVCDTFAHDSSPYLIADGPESDRVSYVPLRDLASQPVAVVQVEFPKSNLRLGQGQLAVFITYFISISLILSIISLFLIGSTVITRIECLNAQVAVIGREGNSASSVHVDGHDEITCLGESINQMLAGLREKDTEIRQELDRKNDFIHVASHELRTPLQPLIGFLDMFIEMPEEFGINEQLRKHLTLCRESVGREHYVVDRMLQLSLLSDKHEEIKPEITTFYPAPLIHAIRTTLPGITDSEIMVVIPENLQISTDKLYFYMILETLLSNAARYSRSPKHVTVRYDNQSGMHVFSVEDNGPGFPPEAIPNIFRPFYLVDGEKLSRKYDRLGLNLPISYKLAEKLHGKITVESIEGKGSTFILSVPRQPAGNDPAP